MAYASGFEKLQIPRVLKTGEKVTALNMEKFEIDLANEAEAVYSLFCIMLKQAQGDNDERIV